MKEEERQAFDNSLQATMQEWIEMAMQAKMMEELERQREIRRIAEIG